VFLNALSLQQVGPKAGAPVGAGPGTTQETAPSGPAPAAPSQSTGSTLVLLMPIFVVMVVMLLMGRNQKKKDAEVRAKLRKGDRIVSQSGLVGELVELDDRFAKVKLGAGMTVQMLASSIAPLEQPAAVKADDKQLKDLKDAKALADKK
jgi:preprotein translocase subunit YajC